MRDWKVYNFFRNNPQNWIKKEVSVVVCEKGKWVQKFCVLGAIYRLYGGRAADEKVHELRKLIPDIAKWNDSDSLTFEMMLGIMKQAKI